MRRVSPYSYTIRERSNTRRIRLNLSLRNGVEVIVPKGFDRRRVERILAENPDQVQRAVDRVQQCLQNLAPREIHLKAIGESWKVE